MQPINRRTTYTSSIHATNECALKSKKKWFFVLSPEKRRINLKNKNAIPEPEETLAYFHIVLKVMPITQWTIGSNIICHTNYVGPWMGFSRNFLKRKYLYIAIY